MIVNEIENLNRLTPSMILAYIDDRVSIEVERHLKSKMGSPTNDDNVYETANPTASKCSFDLERVIGRISGQGHGVEYVKSYMYKNYEMKLPDSRIIPFHVHIQKEYVRWSKKPLNKIYPILWVDSLSFPLTENGKVIAKELFYCFGIDVYGTKHTMAIVVETNKEQAFANLMEDISKRGVKDVLMLCVPDVANIKAQAGDYFPEACIQSNIFSQADSSVVEVPYKYRIELKKSLATIYKSDSKEEAEKMFEVFKKRWEGILPKQCKKWKKNMEGYHGYWRLPEILKDLVYSPNMARDINKRLKLIVEPVAREDNLKLIFFRYQQDFRNRAGHHKMRNWNAISLVLDEMFPNRIYD